MGQDSIQKRIKLCEQISARICIFLFNISEQNLLMYSEGWRMTQNLMHTFLPRHWWNVHVALRDTEGEVRSPDIPTKVFGVE
jgi:hypothetical protein